MIKHIEKMKEGYVLCTLDKNGNTGYLRSLHEPGKWEVVYDIEMSTKYANDEAANMSYWLYKNEMGNNAGEFVMIPFEIEYRLLQEE